MKKLLSHILRALYPEPKPDIQVKILNDENDWITIQIRMCRPDRIELIDCIETSGEVSLKLLAELSESIRNNQLNKSSWAQADRLYYERMMHLFELNK